MDKFQILELARKHGLETLDAVVTDNGKIPENIEYPIITKSISPVVGGWKADVHICKNEEELREAYKKILSSEVLLQKYIEKKNEYVIEGFSVNSGKEAYFSIETTYNYLLPGYYSPYMTVGRMDNPEIARCLSGMLREIGFEGIFEIEFLMDQDDSLYFSEINFRNSTWSWASTSVGANLPILWAQGMVSGRMTDLPKINIPEGYTAMVEPIDYGKRVGTGQISKGEWLIDFRKMNCGYYYCDDDPGPFIACVNNWENLS